MTRPTHLIGLNLDVDRDRFHARLTSWAAGLPTTGPLNPIGLWSEEIHAQTAPLIASGRILQVKTPHGDGAFCFTTPAELVAAGDVSWWWHDVVLDLPLGERLTAQSILPPVNMEWHYWAFGGRVYAENGRDYASHFKRLKFVHKSMATRNRYTVTFVRPTLPAQLIADATLPLDTRARLV